MKGYHTKLYRCTKSMLIGIIIVILSLLMSACGATDMDKATSAISKEINPGEVFEKGSYINVDEIIITDNGESFLIQNNSSNIIRVVCSIVGVKNDGSYEILGMPSFCGIDKTQYEKDKSNNGWAVETTTNLIRPNETLEAKFNYMDYYRDLDVNNDGFYDVIFTISPQTDEDTITSSSTDIVSDVYKLKV